MQDPTRIVAFPDKRVPPPESAKAKRAYADYEAQGEGRSLAKLAAQWGKSRAYVGQLERWSQAYNWQARLKQYEDKQLEARRRRRQVELDAMDERHWGYGRSSLYEAVKFISEHLNDPGTTIAQAVSLMKTSYELERLARGAATTRVEGDMTLAVLAKEYINIDPNEEGSEQ